jgi:hypothetical protein
MDKDEINGEAVTALLNSTATSRQSDTAAAIILRQYTLTSNLGMVLNMTRKEEPATPNIAGAVDPLAR